MKESEVGRRKSCLVSGPTLEDITYTKEVVKLYVIIRDESTK